MSLRLITPATTPAVALADAKAHLRVDSTDEDALITAMVAAATETAEQITGRSLMPQTWELTLDSFPKVFELTRVPVASVTSVKYYDVAGTLTTLAEGNYVLNATDGFGPAFVSPAYSAVWPATRSQPNAVAVRFVAGYATAADVPAPIKQWILLAVGDLYDKRSRSNDGRYPAVPMQFADGLIDAFKVWSL